MKKENSVSLNDKTKIRKRTKDEEVITLWCIKGHLKLTERAIVLFLI